MKILDDVLTELNLALAKWPLWPTDPLHALSVLGEEYGELNKEVLQMVYEPHKTSHSAIRKEAVQVAAMSIRFLMSLDQYEYKKSFQHNPGNV